MTLLVLCSHMTRVLYWFRKALRLHDNPALLHAIKEADQLYLVFIIDPWFVCPERVGANRMKFLLECLVDIDAQLRDAGSRLIVLSGPPVMTLREAVKAWNIEEVVFEKDTEPYARVRDAEIAGMLAREHVRMSAIHGHTLYDIDEALVYMPTFLLRSRLPQLIWPAVSVIPTLAELGYDESQATTHFIGGEREGMRRVLLVKERDEWTAAFSKPETDPTHLVASTTVLSPYLKFGAVSCRTFYWTLLDVYSKEKGHTEPPVSLLGQLLWREFFYFHSVATPNFDRMEGNPICKQIPWDRSPEMTRAWEEGRTGYPWIDAAMMQLRREGWIHHLARHAVACFLTRGDLYQSWESGVQVFDKLLLDADWALNNGNWLWLSASAFFHQYFRVYSPVSFAKVSIIHRMMVQKYDPEGNYIREFLPIFRGFPSRYIYEPWDAPKEVLKMHGIILGETYPRRIVIHDDVVKRNVSQHAEAFKAAKKPNTGYAGTKRTLKEFLGSSPPL